MAVSSVSPLRGPDPEFCLGNLRGRGWPRRLTRNQLTLLGFPTTRPPLPHRPEILALSVSTLQSQRSQVSALTRLPPGCLQPRKSQGSSGKPFSARSWRRPEGEPGARSNCSWGMFCLEWRRGKLGGEEPESFGDREVTSGCRPSKDAEGRVLEAPGTGVPDCVSDGDGSSWSLWGVWEEEVQAAAGGQA